MKSWLAPLAPLALAVGLAASGAGPAVAAATPGPVDVTLENVPTCPTFSVTIQATGKAGTIVLQEGERHIYTSPNLRVTITGPTGKSVSYVATGAVEVQNLPGGNQDFTATGWNLVTVPEANGHPRGLFVTVGTVSWTLDSAGNEVGNMFSGTGRVIDVCQQVAP